MAVRLEWMRALPRQPEAVLSELIAAARWALSLGLFGGLLAGMGYAAREKVFVPAAVSCLALLSLGFVYGIGQSLKNWENVPPALSPVQSLGGPGFILASQPGKTAIVLLQGPAEAAGPRVVAIPGQPLLYQEEFPGRDSALTSLLPAPFEDDNPWFLKSLAIDLRLNAENLRQRLDRGALSFLVYAGALIFLLSSLIFIMKFSAWPLVNTVLGCLAFRGVLAMETFFNSPEMQDAFDSFLKNRMSLFLTVPLIFCGIGALAHLYSFLAHLAKRQDDNAV